MRKFLQVVLLICNIVGYAWPMLTIAEHSQSGQGSMASSTSSDASLNEFLRGYLKKLSVEEDKTTRYLSKWIDLNDDGMRDVVIYVIGDSWCGSGGCTTIIVRMEGVTYQVVSKTLITNLPICMLATKSHGWHDISVWVQGGGVRNPYEAELRFDGKRYPISPFVHPARPLVGKTKRELVIFNNSKNAKLLYP
jgi:hypothetical protein